MAGARKDWRAIHDALTARGIDHLDAAELDLLGESLFWLDRPDASIEVLGRAFAAHVAGGDHAAAAMTAWQIFYDHALVGERALASGWLERARHHAGVAADPVTGGFLDVAEADDAAGRGDVEQAVTRASAAIDAGRAAAHPDLLAMGLQTLGRMQIARGRHDDGIRAFDEAMVAVVNGELAPLFTGWVYCNALATCHDVGDLGRAVEWSDAAMKWCDGLRDGQLYPGICRLHVVELDCLRGEWSTAVSGARRACAELTSHDPRYAGEAHYRLGELHRLAGELDLAEEAFTRGHELGRHPQPGLARVRLAQGRTDAAVAALSLALGPPPAPPMHHVELLATLVQAHLATGAVDDADSTARRLAEVAEAAGSDYLRALALLAGAEVAVACGDGPVAYRSADTAHATFRSMGLAYDCARARVVRGQAARLAGDDDTARLELATARDEFARLGADLDAARVAGLLGAGPPSQLSAREIDVLRLVARGGTNKEVAAALHVSEHTVARHLSNIYTKLGVGSRAAATAFAFEHSLL